MSDDESVFETFHPPEAFVTKDFVEDLTFEINRELTSLTNDFGIDPFSRLIPLIVDGLASLVECCGLIQELSETRNQLLKDLKCLEKQFDKEKEFRRCCETNLLQIEFENEEERRKLNKIIYDQDQVIRTLRFKLKEISFDEIDFPEDKNLFVQDFQNYDLVLKENDSLLKERKQLLVRIAELESSLSGHSATEINTQIYSIESPDRFTTSESSNACGNCECTSCEVCTTRSETGSI